MDPGLSGRVALVTGANQGIGAAVADALAAQGAAVMRTFLRMPPSGDPALPAAYDEERARGVPGIEVDLTDAGTIPGLFDAVEAALGPVEVLVHCASSWLGDTFRPGDGDRFGRTDRRVGAETFDAQFAVDAQAGAVLIAEFARRHLDRGARWGRIVTLTSGGTDGFPEEVSYGAAKAALESYTLAAAAELYADGITANVLHPPATDTGWVTEAVRAAAPRIAQPGEVGEVAVLLCAEQGRHLTGQRVRMR